MSGFVRLLAAALDVPLGAPGNVVLNNASSVGNFGSTAGINFSSSGALSLYRHGVPIHDSYWVTPQLNMGDYEIRATLSSGDTPTGTFDTWEALSTTREWALVAGTDENLTSSILIEIRWTGNNVVQDSATYTLTASNPDLGGGDPP